MNSWSLVGREVLAPARRTKTLADSQRTPRARSAEAGAGLGATKCKCKCKFKCKFKCKCKCPEPSAELGGVPGAEHRATPIFSTLGPGARQYPASVPDPQPRSPAAGGEGREGEEPCCSGAAPGKAQEEPELPPREPWEQPLTSLPLWGPAAALGAWGGRREQWS